MPSVSTHSCSIRVVLISYTCQTCNIQSHSFKMTESAAQKVANKTAQAILSGKYNKRLKDENIDDFIEVTN